VLICISLYDVKGSPKAAASDWTAKHSTVLGDLIGSAVVSHLAISLSAAHSTAGPTSSLCEDLVEPRRIELLTS
jgi:hypothetical protein